ncbi:MAG TPA: hypothetical protein VFK57_18725 [Vicinamibacterales bacterium]|nr:hypothetical protein [Vicinamibacterales bacterium]
MLKRTVLSAFCAAAMLVTGVAYAQNSATLTLRSGEKVSGDLIDLGGVGFTVRVSGSERQIPQNDVAVIDFTGGTMSDADWAKFTGSTQVILRNGQTIDGQLYDIGGATPLRLTIKTGSGDRELSSNEVARIVMARPDNVATGTTGVAATPAVPGAITVQANQPWTSTGMTVRRGQTLTFQTTGEVQLSTDAADTASADGAKKGRYAPNAPMKQVLAGALIGRIGNGAPFAIGNQTSIVAPASGILFLGINDDGFEDNKGNFQVVVK